jgi:hypothetical protein
MELTRCLAWEDAMHDENAIKMAQRDGTVALIYRHRRAATPDNWYRYGVAAEDIGFGVRNRGTSPMSLSYPRDEGKLPNSSALYTLLQRPAIDRSLYT